MPNKEQNKPGLYPNKIKQVCNLQIIVVVGFTVSCFTCAWKEITLYILFKTELYELDSETVCVICFCGHTLSGFRCIRLCSAALTLCSTLGSKVY